MAAREQNEEENVDGTKLKLDKDSPCPKKWSNMVSTDWIVYDCWVTCLVLLIHTNIRVLTYRRIHEFKRACMHVSMHAMPDRWVGHSWTCGLDLPTWVQIPGLDLLTGYLIPGLDLLTGCPVPELDLSTVYLMRLACQDRRARTCLPCAPACPPVSCLPACLPACLLACLPACRPLPCPVGP